MKHPVTLRLDPDLLAQAKSLATLENRTLTNFIETLIKQHVGTAERAGLRLPGRRAGATSSKKLPIERTKAGRA